DQRATIAGPGFQSKQEDGFIAAKLIQGAYRFDSYRISGIAHGVHQITEHLESAQVAALHERKERIRSEQYGRVFFTAVLRLHLDVSQTAHERRWITVFELR